MPVGIALPIGVNTSGGVKLADSDENDNKIISLALGMDDNENAFQQGIALGIDMVFAISDPAIRGRIIGRMRQIFRRFEAQKRYRLVPSSVKWTEDATTQDLKLEFKYINLESDEPRVFSKTFSGEQL